MRTSPRRRLDGGAGGGKNRWLDGSIGGAGSMIDEVEAGKGVS